MRYVITEKSFTTKQQLKALVRYCRCVECVLIRLIEIPPLHAVPVYTMQSGSSKSIEHSNLLNISSYLLPSYVEHLYHIICNACEECYRNEEKDSFPPLRSSLTLANKNTTSAFSLQTNVLLRGDSLVLFLSGRRRSRIF